METVWQHDPHRTYVRIPEMVHAGGVFEYQGDQDPVSVIDTQNKPLMFKAKYFIKASLVGLSINNSCVLSQKAVS